MPTDPRCLNASDFLALVNRHCHIHIRNGKSVSCLSVYVRGVTSKEVITSGSANSPRFWAWRLSDVVLLEPCAEEQGERLTTGLWEVNQDE